MSPKYPLPFKDPVHSRTANERSLNYYKMLVKAYNIRQQIKGNPFKIPDRLHGQIAGYLHHNKSDDVHEALTYFHITGTKF